MYTDWKSGGGGRFMQFPVTLPTRRLTQSPPRGIERIESADSKQRKITNVTCDNGQIMHFGGRGDHGIFDQLI